uniref:AAA family ATPase n=1 Tax=Oceanobacillus sp. FSL W7-1293 TaxID=2921699 RepID=UPI00403F0B13
MITGLFLRHYKTYQGLYFIPICNDYNNQYSVFVGNNGIGKSSIMEGLNTFFNNGEWNKNKSGKKMKPSWLLFFL